MLDSLFNKDAGLAAPTIVFSCEYCKSFKNSFFYRTPLLGAFDYSNNSKIFRKTTASKFQGQHATQFNRYESLCPATKTEIHCRFFNEILRNFRGASFENNFGGLLLKRKQRRRRLCSDPCGFKFSLFPGQLFIY